VDAISDGQEVLIPGIMEHIERAGIHSGDSMAVYPPTGMTEQEKDTVVDYAVRIARALNVRGIMNVQYVIEDGTVYVLEVNPRASRTVPYLSKVTGIPMIKVATKAMLGKTLAELGYKGGLYPERPYFAVKAPVFSFAKLTEVDVSLGPEMKSTGEIMGIDPDFSRALYKAMVASGVNVPPMGSLIATIADRDKDEAAPLIRQFAELGFRVYATGGTARFLRKRGIAAERVLKIHEGSPNIVDLIQSGKIDLLVNTISKDGGPAREGDRIRRTSVEHDVPCLTSLDTTRALLVALSAHRTRDGFEVRSLDAYLRR
jgi:carbamoyl-phosphate synthase large subunit